MSLIEVHGVSKTYKQGEIDVHALEGVELNIEKGEFTAFVGPSGSGKTTLLNIIGGLDTATRGRVILDGKSIEEMSGAELSDFRRDHIGFVFQEFNLIPVLSASENVEYVLLLRGVPPKERKAKVYAMLERVGLAGMEERRPAQLSGGQQQRVAVARAMVARPSIILADEPTANLDSATGTALLDLMRELNEKDGMTFVFSTHDQKIMDRARRLVHLQDGMVEHDERR